MSKIVSFLSDTYKQGRLAASLTKSTYDKMSVLLRMTKHLINDVLTLVIHCKMKALLFCVSEVTDIVYSCFVFLYVCVQEFFFIEDMNLEFIL